MTALTGSGLRAARLSRLEHEGAVAAAYCRRDYRLARSYRLGFVMDLLATVFQLGLFLFLGRFIDSSRGPSVDGVGTSYFTYAVVGVLLVRLVDSMVSSFAAKVRREQLLGTLEVVLATSPSSGASIAQAGTYDVAYAAATLVVSLLLSIVLGAQFDPTVASLAVALVAVMATMLLFAAVGICAAAVVLVFQHGVPLLGTVPQLLGFLAGAYFPTSVLPGPLAQVSRFVPLTWSLDATRAALQDGEAHLGAVGMLLVTAIGAALLAFVLLRTAIDHARTEGTLAQH